jgi:hypothetical protein
MAAYYRYCGGQCSLCMRRVALAGEYAGDQAGHEAVSAAKAGGEHVGLEDRKQRACVR